MKKLALLVFAVAAAHAAFASGAIKWGRDYKTAQAAAAKSHKLMMVDMYTDWCVWCKRLDAYVYPSKEVLAESKNFVPLKMNAEQEGQTAAGVYGVRGFPTVLFLKPNGDLVYMIKGFRRPTDFAKEMRTALAKAKS